MYPAFCQCLDLMFVSNSIQDVQDSYYLYQNLSDDRIPNLFRFSDTKGNELKNIMPKILPFEKSLQGYMKIYDRWGGIIYNEDNGKWNGTQNDKMINNGLYAYSILIYDFKNKPFIYIDLIGFTCS